MSGMVDGWLYNQGTPIMYSPSLPDGAMYHVAKPKAFLIGTSPSLTEIEYAGALGRYIVRRGMADVLAYIGEEVGPPPSRTPKADAILRALRKGVST